MIEIYSIKEIIEASNRIFNSINKKQRTTDIKIID